MPCNECIFLRRGAVDQPLRTIVKIARDCGECSSRIARHNTEEGVQTLLGHLEQASNQVRTLERAQRRAQAEIDNLRSEYAHVENRIAVLEHVRDTSAREADAELARRREELDRRTSELLDASMPIIPVEHTIAVLPMIGTFNHARASILQERVLVSVSRMGLKIVIVDLTALQHLEAETATCLSKLFAAVRLLGTTIVCCGLSPEIAKFAATTDIDFHGIRMFQTLASALTEVGFCRVSRHATLAPESMM